METQKIGFLEKYNSEAKMIERSSDRIFTLAVLIFAIFMTVQVTVFGFIQNIEMTIMAPIAGALFIQIAGSVLFYLFQRKKDELKEIKQ